MSEKRDTLPQGWEWKKLEDVVILNMGQSPDSSTYNSDGNGLPFFQGKKDFGKMYPVATQYCSSPVKIALENDILMSVRAPVGPTNIANMKCCIGRGLAGIRAKQEIETLFLYYFFKYFEEEISNKGKGSTFSAITKVELATLDIPLPPLEEQRRIVGVLDGLFGKIDTSIALLDESIASASSLMPSALNEVFEELGEKWEKKKLEECTFFQNGYAFKSQDFSETQKTFQVIRIGNVLDLNKNPVYIDEQKELERFRLYENDIVISMTGTRQKQDYLFVSLIQKAKYYLNQRVGKITAKSNSVSKFIFYYLQSRHFREKIFEFETGTVNQGNISGKDIMNMLIPLPPLDIQTQTVAYLDALHLKADALKKAQEKKKEALLALKASLLESAFKGAL